MNYFKKTIALLTMLSYFIFSISVNGALAQEREEEEALERSVTVGETTVEYVLPVPPDLQLTPPTFFSNPPIEARLRGVLTGEPSPFDGVIYNQASNAWMLAQIESIPRYFEAYSTALREQMITWTYLQIDEYNLRLATEMEDSRIQVNALERQLDSERRLRRRSILRPVAITASVCVLVGSLLGFGVGFHTVRN